MAAGALSVSVLWQEQWNDRIMCSQTCSPSCTSSDQTAMQVRFFFFFLIFLNKDAPPPPRPPPAPHQFCVIRSAILRSRGTEGVKRVIAFKPSTVGKLMRSPWSINHIGTNQLPANWKMKRRRLQPLPQAPTPSACLHSDDWRRAQTRARRLLSVRERRASLRSRAALHVPSNKSVGQKREKKNK